MRNRRSRNRRQLAELHRHKSISNRFQVRKERLFPFFVSFAGSIFTQPDYILSVVLETFWSSKPKSPSPPKPRIVSNLSKQFEQFKQFNHFKKTQLKTVLGNTVLPRRLVIVKRSFTCFTGIISLQRTPMQESRRPLCGFWKRKPGFSQPWTQFTQPWQT